MDMNDSVAASSLSTSSENRENSISRPVPEVRGVGKWHLLTILAGCMLVATFFLPISRLNNWSTGEIPVRLFRDLLRESDVRQAVTQGPGSLGTLVYLIAAGILPHAWGLLAALFSAMSLLGWMRPRRVPQAIGVAIGVPVGAAWAISVVRSMAPVVRNPRGGALPLVFSVLLAATLIVAVAGVLYALLAIRRRGWAYLYHGFAGAGTLVFIMLALHTHMLLGGASGAGRYIGLTGLTITATACCLFLFSRIGEARAITGLTWRRTLWYLLTLRLHKASRPVGLCPGCGYYLYGLRDQRCPECGRPFTFEEVNASPQVLAFAGSTCDEDTRAGR
jgi:hypothetical protein